MEYYHDIQMLSPDISGWHVRLKVLGAITFEEKPEKKVMVIILTNEQGIRIEAIVKNKYVRYYDNFIEEGQWISIMHFSVRPNDSAVRATKHKFVIIFIDRTIVKKVDAITEYGDNQFTSFRSITDKIVDDDVLIDVIGAVFDVGHLEHISGNVHDVHGWRVSFTLKDKEQNLLHAMAEGSVALHFNYIYHANNGLRLVVGLRFWKIYRYVSGLEMVRICSFGAFSKVYPNPNINEAHEIQKMLATKDALQNASLKN